MQETPGRWILVTILLLGRPIISILSGRSSVVVLSPHWYYKFCSSMHGVCLSRTKPGQPPECGTSEKALAVASKRNQQHSLDFSQTFLLLDWIFLQISVLKYFDLEQALLLGCSESLRWLWLLWNLQQRIWHKEKNSCSRMETISVSSLQTSSQ